MNAVKTIRIIFALPQVCAVFFFQFFSAAGPVIPDYRIRRLFFFFFSLTAVVIIFRIRTAGEENI